MTHRPSSTQERRARMIEKEGIEQAKMWLRRSDSPASPKMAAAILLSAYVRMHEVLGTPLSEPLE